MIEKTATDVKKLINSANNKITVLDVREKWEYDICHIENSVHIPMGQITSRKDMLNKDDIVIVVCHHGIRSRMVAKYLDNEGFREVINLTGGVDAWSNEVDETMGKYV